MPQETLTQDNFAYPLFRYPHVNYIKSFLSIKIYNNTLKVTKRSCEKILEAELVIKYTPKDSYYEQLNRINKFIGVNLIDTTSLSVTGQRQILTRTVEERDIDEHIQSIIDFVKNIHPDIKIIVPHQFERNQSRRNQSKQATKNEFEELVKHFAKYYE